jgi:mono/diheme cytochrome c family protein
MFRDLLANRRGVAALAFSAALIAALGACGDQAGDGRGYTKEPLERPGFIVRGEQRSAMAALGRPNYPRADVIDLPEAPPEEAVPAEPIAAADLPPGVTQEMLASGRQLFEGRGNCFSCHGMNAGGGPLGPDLRDGEWIHIDGSMASLEQVIIDGVQQPQQYPAAMPAMGGAQLSAQEVEAIAAYIYALNPR